MRDTIRPICWFLLGMALMATAWRPQPKQAAVLARSEYEILAGGARFGGKTALGIVWMIPPDYVSHPKYRGLVLRRNSKDLGDWIFKAKQIYGNIGAVKVGSQSPVFRLPAGGEIVLGHLGDENAYEQYQGQEFQRVNIEELTQIPNERLYEQVISSCRTSIADLPPQVFSSANPGGPGHVWVKSRFVDVAENKTYWPTLSNGKQGRPRIFIPFTIDDNPLGRAADPSYELTLEGIQDEALRLAWRYGRWDTFSGQFFDMWRSDVHIIKPFAIPRHWNRYTGQDWNYDPCAGVWMAVDGYGTHVIYRERYKGGLAPGEAAKEILDMEDEGEKIVRRLADPSMWTKGQFGHGPDKAGETRKSIAQMFHDAGCYIHQANNDRVNGWNVMRELMYWDVNKKPRFYVFDTCPNVCRILPGLPRDPHNIEDVDKKSEAHLADAIRYCVMHTYQTHKPTEPPDEIEQMMADLTRDTRVPTWGNN